MVSKIDVLKTARQKIIDGWTRGTLARDSFGNKVNVDSDDACQFCASGAIIRALHEYGIPHNRILWSPAYLLMNTNNSALYRTSVPWWNDTYVYDKDEVVKAFDNAIEYWESQDV